MDTVEQVRPPTNDTEQKLLDAALTLFAQKGYESASVREIIESIGVTRPVLYYYCSSKEDLFKRVVHWKHAEAYRELRRVVDETAGCANRLRAILRGSFSFCAADPRVPRVMFQTTYGPIIPGICEFMEEMSKRRFLIVHQVMQDGLDNGDLQGGDAASLSLMFCCIMDQHINVLSRLPDADRKLTKELADELLKAFLFGVGAGKRRRVALPPFPIGNDDSALSEQQRATTVAHDTNGALSEEGQL